jgi:long-chain fatty acid transport protein
MGGDMRLATKAWLGALFACGSLYCRDARATTEVPAQYDARSVGLGGTGASFIENGASVFLNPAALDGITTLAVTAVISPVQPVLTAPLAPPPMNASVKADTPFFPLFLAGAGFRLTDQIVAGLAVYPTAGFGSTYTKAIGGQDLSMSIAQFEAAPAVSFKIIDGLSVGLSYRITYTRQAAHQPPPFAPAPTDVTLDGFNYFGIQAGLYYRPLDIVHLAFTYRSRVDSELSGTTESGPAKFDTKSQFNSPHRFRLGASISPPGVPLLVAADIKYMLYADSNQTQEITVNTPMGAMTTIQRLDWKNVLAFGLGVEYMIVPLVAARVGYSISQSATPESTANPFTPPPGALQSVHLGLGLKLPMLDLDAGGFYAFSNKTINASPSNMMVIPGEYKITSLLFSVSATYHL